MLRSLYEQLFEDSVVAYFSGKGIKDKKNNYTDLEIIGTNAKFREIFKRSEDEVKGLLISEVLSKERLDEWKKTLNKARRIRKASLNSYIVIEDTYFKIDVYIEENDIVVRMNPIKYDRFKFSKYLREAPFIVWLKNEDGIYLDINEKFEEEFNIKREDIVGKTDYEIFQKEWAEYYQKEDKLVLKENKMHVSYFKKILLFNKKDEEKYYASTKWPHINDDGTVIGVIGAAKETTIEAGIIKKIKTNEEILNQISNNINDVIVIRDEDKFNYISPKFEKIFGINPKDINLYESVDYIQKNWNEVDHELKIEPYSYNGLSEGIIKFNKNGEDKWVFIKYSPICDEKGNLIKKVGIISDITKYKLLEREIENLRTDFIANLSHELRTPINLILSSLQVIDLKMNKLNIEEEKYFNQYLNIVKQNGLRLLKLVNNLIDTTKLNSGKFSHNPKNKDIIKCVEDICLSVSQYVENNNMSIIFDTDEEEKIIGFDQDNIERIILNLLSNAIKFNKKNGEIYVTINCEDDIKISVKDTGIGIPSDKLDTVFKRFEQANGKTKIEKEGSGIGLSLVKSLANMHGGDAEVKSILGEGTEFIITLPDKNIDENMEKVIDEDYNSMNFGNISNLNIEFSDIYS